MVGYYKSNEIKERYKFYNLKGEMEYKNGEKDSEDEDQGDEDENEIDECEKKEDSKSLNKRERTS